MKKLQDRIIYRAENGWANKRADATRPTSIHVTQKEAYLAAKKILVRQGGGRILIKGLDGRVKQKTTLIPGVDPMSIRG